MRTRIVDYQIIRPLDEDHADRTVALSASPAAAETSQPNAAPGSDQAYLAQAPSRLGIGDAPVVVHAVTGASSEGPESLEGWLYSLSGARSPYLPVLLELGTDPGDGDAPDGSSAASGTYWSHSWTGEATLAAPPFNLSLAFVLWLVAGAARGAHVLHEAGLAHGSITSRSIRFNERAVTLDLPPGPVGRPDGLIRQIGRVADLDLLDPGTARGELPSRASDVWALGAILHLGLTGKLLHPGLAEDPPVTAVQRVMFQPPTITPGLDPEAGRILTACLAPDPAHRPRTAGELADQLETLGRQR